jgi:hypothetical protein
VRRPPAPEQRQLRTGCSWRWFMDMQLIQMLLPVADNDGRPFPDEVLEEVKRKLVDRFGGVTAYARAPAEGVWARGSQERQRDDLIIVEVMAPEVDEDWWATFKEKLEVQLGQDEIVIRSFCIHSVGGKK